MLQTFRIRIFSLKFYGTYLNKQKFQLVCGENSTMEKKEQTMRAGWASDPVHPNSHIFTKMALNLIEKIASATDAPGASVSRSWKRTWSASNRE